MHAMRLHYRGEPFPLDALHRERREAARMRADAIREASAKAADPAKALHTETRGLPQMDVGSQREGPGLPMTGNPAKRGS